MRMNPAVLPATKPRVGGSVRTLMGYELMHGSPKGSLCLDEIIVAPDEGRIYIHSSTYGWFKNDPQAMQLLVHEKAEAVRLMQTRMVDVSRYAPERVAKPKPMVQPDGIKALCLHLQNLVADMSSVDVTDPVAVHDMAKRYGKARDTMADLRSAFQEAEGCFEIVQALLVAKMGVE